MQAQQLKDCGISLGSCAEYYRDLPAQIHCYKQHDDKCEDVPVVVVVVQKQQQQQQQTTKPCKAKRPTRIPPPAAAYCYCPQTPPPTKRKTMNVLPDLLPATPDTLPTVMSSASSDSTLQHGEYNNNSKAAAVMAPSLLFAPPKIKAEPTTGACCTPNEAMGSVEECDHIKVAIRLRPLGPQELVVPKWSRLVGGSNSATQDARAWSLVQESTTDGCSSNSSNDNNNSTTLLQKGVGRQTAGRNLFSFDAVYPEGAHTEQVYQQVARPIVRAVASGRHGTIFSYGQTGSGKTFTMQGTAAAANGSSATTANNQEYGIIQMAAVDLFEQIATAGQQRDHVVKAQYFEIYNEQIRDLLTVVKSKNSNDAVTPVELNVLSAREDPATRSVYVNAKEERVESVQDVFRLLQQGNRNRACATTNLNTRSSRSHAIFRLLLESRGQGATRKSVLNLVDLAGSENSKHAGVSGAIKREGGKINQSLLSLSRVIHALSLPPKKRPKHISFRDAKLTRILQSHLSGNACMAVLCCVSASRAQLEETRSTLKFAASAKRIQMKATVNEEVDQQSLLSQLQLELAEVREALKLLQSREAAGNTSVPCIINQVSMRTQTTYSTSQSASSGVVLAPRLDLPGWLSPQKQADDDSSGAKELPPVSEVMVSSDLAFKGDDDGSVSRVDEAEKRSKFLEDKLEATDELVASLFKDLEETRQRHQELERSRLERLGHPVEKTERLEDEDSARKTQQYTLIKYAVFVALAFHFLGYPECFIATSTFLLLALAVM